MSRAGTSSLRPVVLTMSAEQSCRCRRELIRFHGPLRKREQADSRLSSRELGQLLQRTSFSAGGAAIATNAIRNAAQPRELIALPVADRPR